MNKDDIRRAALEQRRTHARALTSEARGALERQLADIVLPHLLTARVVAGYHPMRDEISPLPLMVLLSSGQTAVFPWFADRDSRMIFREGPATIASPWGMLQPDASAEALAPDTILVPLVRGDRLGSRIGHGKGHYDRALAHLRQAGPVFTIGIAWEHQIADEPLPADPWDVPLDAIATPAEWIDCRHNRAEAHR